MCGEMWGCVDLCLGYQTCWECLLMWPTHVIEGHRLDRAVGAGYSVVQQPRGYGSVAHPHPGRRTNGTVVHHRGGYVAGAVGHHMERHPGETIHSDMRRRDMVVEIL